jgi:hypothetical protein
MLTLVPTSASRSPANAEAPAVFNIVFAYDNLAAALWATEALDSFRAQLPDGAEPRLSPWSLATLENRACRAEATAEAVGADLIVVAISNRFSQLPISVEGWLRTVLAGRRKTSITVAAVFGDADLMDGADSLRLQTMQRLAEEHGCEFLAPGVTDTAWGVCARHALDEASVRESKIA